MKVKTTTLTQYLLLGAGAIDYPSSDDIHRAVQFKDLATWLPAHAERYQLTPLQIVEVNCAALEFIDLLIYRMQCATSSIACQRPGTPMAVDQLASASN